MQFELSSVLIDEILFFMEDQDGIFLFDAQKGTVINTELELLDYNKADKERYIPLPEWGPSDGFRLMRRFTAGLRNVPVREELSTALNRGRGVFRAFKDTLVRFPETEKLWFGYKDREMKREIISWYNAQRESWGLELIGEEPEDISVLVLEDFCFREGTADDRPAAEELHLLCREENPDGTAGMDDWVFPGDINFIAETAEGEFAGYICAAFLPGNDSGNSRGKSRTLHICAVEIKPEYRGLGLGKTLIALLSAHADKSKISKIFIDLPAGREHFSRSLLRENFQPNVQRFCRKKP